MVEAARARQPSDLPRTVEEFDRWNAEQPERWEFIAGVPVMMSPASLPHTLIKGNIFAALRQKLAGTPCHALVDGAEVKSYRLVAIPDVLVLCGELDQTSPTDAPNYAAIGAAWRADDAFVATMQQRLSANTKVARPA